MDIEKIRQRIEEEKKKATLGRVISRSAPEETSPFYGKALDDFSNIGVIPTQFHKEGIGRNINPFLPFSEQIKKADKLQGRGAAWGNAAKSFGANLAAGFLDSLGATLSPKETIDMALGNSENDYGNELNKIAQNLMEWSQDKYPVYDGGESMWSSAYWANLSKQATYSTGIIGESFVEQGILAATTGMIGNAVTIPNKITALLKAVKFLNTTNKIKKIGNFTFGLYQGVKEAYMNGLENLNNVQQEYINRGYSEEEARKIASEAATKSFRMELGPVMLLNGIQYGALGMGNYNPFKRGSVSDVGISGFTENIFTRMIPKTASKGVKRAADWVGNMTSESIEEGFQSFVQGVSKYQTDKERGFLEDKDIFDYTFNKDLRDSMISGGATGGLFKALGSVRNSIIDKNGKDRKNYERLINAFTESTAERAKTNLIELNKALEEKDEVKVRKIRQKMGYENIEAALMFDYMKNDENMTAYNSQINQLKEISDIIKRGDTKGLEFLDLKNEKNEHGENIYAFLKENIDNIILNAEKQKEYLIKNLQHQKNITGEENYEVAEKMTRIQMMKEQNNDTLEKHKKDLSDIIEIEKNATQDDIKVEYKDLMSKIAAFESYGNKITNPSIIKDIEDTKNRIEEIENENTDIDFDEDENVNKILKRLYRKEFLLKQANYELDNDLKKLSTSEGVKEYKNKELKKSVLEYKDTEDIEKLEDIKESLTRDEKVKNIFNEKEIKRIKKDIDDKILKIKSTESKNISTEAKNISTEDNIKSTLNNNKNNKTILNSDGSVNTKVVTDTKTQEEVRENVDKILKVEAEGGSLENAQEIIEEASNIIVDDSEIFFDEDEIFINSPKESKVFAPREFKESKKEVRENLKKAAKKYLMSNPNATLRDYIVAFVNSDGVNIEDVEKLYYYLADGFYSAKNQDYKNNKEEINKVYQEIFEPFNTLKIIQENLSILDSEEITPEQQEKKENESTVDTVNDIEEKSQPVEVDDNGRPVHYIGPKIAVPVIKVPYSGNPYNVVKKVTDGKLEVHLVRDKEAESKEIIGVDYSPEAIKRAFMMNPHLAKKGTPLQVYIPTLDELLDDNNGFVVSDWKRDKDGSLSKFVIPFSTWYNREKVVFEKQNPGQEFVGSKRWIEKVPIFTIVKINGERIRMGSAIHETDWWNEANVADFTKSNDLIGIISNTQNTEAREEALLIAKARQRAVIEEGAEQTRKVREIIWELTNKEDWNNGDYTLIGMKITNVTDGFSLKLPSDEPKRSIREANNDLELGLILSTPDGFAVASKSENGNVRYIPNRLIFNPAILNSNYNGYAVSIIPYAYNDNNEEMYLVQLVDTGYEKAQDKLKYLAESKLKIRDLSNRYEKSFKEDKSSKETQNLREQLSNILNLAGLSENKIKSYLDKPSFQEIENSLLRFYPKQLKNGNYKASFEKDNISGDIANIVVLDKDNNPSIYKPNADSTEPSSVQMLKEVIYTNNDYIEIRDLRKEDPTATIKIANAQPRIHIDFDSEVSSEILKKQVEELEVKQEVKEIQDIREEKITVEEKPKFELTPEKKLTIVNHLFNKVLQNFKEEKVSRRTIAIEIRKAIEKNLEHLKESNPDLYNGILENKNEILGLGDFKDAPLTVREAILNHFNMEELSETDEEDLDTESYIEKNYTKLAQEYDVKTSVSSKLKRVFSGIPVQEKYRKGEYIEGITEYMELDDVFSALQDLLSDAPNDFNVLKQRIRERINLNPEEFGFLNYIENIIENIDTQLQAEILFKLNQTKNKMFFVYSKEKNDKYVLQVMDANSREPLINKKLLIQEQFKSSNIVKNLGNNEYKLDKEKVAEFANRVILIRKSSFNDYDFVRDTLSEVGIYVDSDVLKAIDKSNSGKYKKLLLDVLTKISNNAISLQNKEALNFDNKKENVILKDNNNFLNNFLKEINKFTFNVEQSMYVGGKIINTFSQPNYFTEQLRKIKSLRGTDIISNSNHVVNKFLKNNSTKDNLLISLISKVDGYGELVPESKEILEELSVGYTSLEVLKRKGFKGKDQSITELSSSDYDIALMGFFGDMGKSLSASIEGIPLRMALMTSPTLSDSSQMFLINTPVLKLSREFFRITDNRISAYSDNVARVLYNQLVLPELSRIIEVKNTYRDTLDNKLFYGIPALNNIINKSGQSLLNYIEENDFSLDVMLKKVRENFGTEIDEVIKEVVKSEVDKKLIIDKDGHVSGEWVDNGFIYEDKNVIYSEILDSEYLNSKDSEGTALSKTETAAWDYSINYLLTQAQIQTLFAGDIANYSKAKQKNFQNNNPALPVTENNSKEERLAVYTKISEETSVNLSKRLKSLISPGNRIANSANEKYLQVIIDDNETISSSYKDYLKSWYKNITEEDLKLVDRIFDLSNSIIEFESRIESPEDSSYLIDKKEYEANVSIYNDIKNYLGNKYPEIAGYLENVSTDAQEYTTWQEHLHIAFNMGKISEETYQAIYKKLSEQSKGNFEGNFLTEKEKLIFQPMKPLHSGMYFKDNFQDFVYVKTSSFPLLPELTKDLKLDNVRKNLEKLQQDKNLSVRASYTSGVKVGKVKNSVNINQLLNNTDIDLSDSYMILDRDNFSIQQEKPFKTDKNIDDNIADRVGRGTQSEKFLLSNGINKIQEKIFSNLFSKQLLEKLGIPYDEKISGADLYKIYTELAVSEQNLRKDMFLKSLDIDPEDFQIGSVSSMEKLQATLSKRLTNRQDKEILELKYYVKEPDGEGKYYNKAEVEALDLKPVSAEFIFPIWLSPNSRKFESVLNSIIKNEFIKLSLPGNSFVVASEEGFVPNKTLEELSKEELKGIVFTENYNGKELLPERIVNGVTYPAQVLIASKFRRKKVVNGKTVTEIIDFNTPEYINPETGRIDSKKVPSEVLQLFSFRIPSSAHQSGSLVEIVGFLPHTVGDLMIVPKEHTTKIGEDYDIDARYTYSGNYVVEEDGTIRFLKEEDIPSYPEEELSKIYNEYKEYKKTLVDYIKNERPDLPKNQRDIYSEIGTTQFLIKVLKAKGSDENSEEILALEEEIKALENRNSVLEEINNLHDEFIKKREYKINEYIEAKKYYGNKLSLIENDIINLYKSVYSSNNDEIQKLITTTINTDMAENTVKLMDAAIRSSKNNKNFSIYGYEHQKGILRSGASGKLGIGVHSNWVVWNSLVQQADEEIRLVDGDTDFSVKIGNFTSNGKLGNIFALRPDTEYENFKPRRLSEINMENQNSATDNQKLLIMGRRNENKYTINVFALMCNLGFDKDYVNIDGKTVEMLLPSLFINQPILRRYVELREKYSSLFAEYTKDIEDTITEQLRKEFATNVNFTTDTEEVIPFFNNIELEKHSKKLTGQLLYDSLVKPVSEETQWAVYQIFLNLQSHTTNVNKVMQAMNIDKGLGISYFNILAKKDTLINEITEENLSITNVESLFGTSPDIPVYENNTEEIKKLLREGYIKVGQNNETGEVFLRKPNSPNSAKLLNSISLGYYLWGNIFPFENKYFSQQIDDILGERRNDYSNETMEIRYEILSAIREYMYSSNIFDIYDSIDDINQERRRLLIDEPSENQESLANYLLRLKKESLTNDDLKSLFNKHFFRNLEFSINKKEPSIIKFNVNSNNSFNKNLPHTELLLMSNSQIKLPSFNGDENYTQEKLVKDLTKYALLTNTENGAIGFRNYIPMEVFKKYNFNDQLNELANLNINGGRYFNMLYNSSIKSITEFINNNNIITDETGTYVKIPLAYSENFSLRKDLNALISNVNRNFGTRVIQIKNNRIYINRPFQEVNKGGFVRQFFQHHPEYAYKLNYKNIKEVKNKNQVNTLTSFNISFGEDIAPKYVSVKGINGEPFLFELISTDINKMSTYRKINKLGGFGVNEYNTKTDVNVSLFDSNNIKVTEPVKKPNYINTKNNVFNLPSSSDNGITVSELMERFEKSNLPDNTETRKLKNLLSEIIKFVSPDTRIYEGTDKEGSPGSYNIKNNTIRLDSSQYSPTTIENYYRTFVEEVFHSITAREVENHVDAINASIEVGLDNINLKINYKDINTPAHIVKLVRLYKKASEELIKEEVRKVKENTGKEINWKKAYENIQNRYKKDPRQTDAYRISNLHEFMAGVFTDYNFREKMSHIQFDNTGTSILQQFAEFVRKLVYDISNRVQGNITEETLSTVIDFITVTKTKTKTQSKASSLQEMQETDNKAMSILSKDTEEINSETYNKLNQKKTISGNVKMAGKNSSEAFQSILSIVREFKSAITPKGIISTRISGTEHHFGNPFSHDQRVIDKNPNMIKTESIKESVESFIDWIINGGIPKFEDRRQWMIEQFKSGKLKGKDILYYTELNEPSHANALDYFINNYDWNNQQSQSEINNQKESASNIIFEKDDSTGYRERTIKNASADATIAIAVDFNSAGEILTKNSVLNQGKVYMPIDGNKLEVTKERVDKIVNALNSIGKDEISLNIAGNGIYTMKGKYTQEQVDKFTYDLLKAIVESSDLKVKISSIRTGGQTGFDEAGAKAGMKLGIPTTVLAPKGWKFRDINGKDISDEKKFKERFEKIKTYQENPKTQEETKGNQIERNQEATGETKYTFAPREVKIRRDVNDIFEQNPELSSIGTSEQYSRYLDTIFPDSKVKDIVYHATNDENFEQILKNGFDLSYFGETDLGDRGFAVYLSFKKDSALGWYGNKLIYAIVNTVNPYYVKDGKYTPERYFNRVRDNVYTSQLENLKEQRKSWINKINNNDIDYQFFDDFKGDVKNKEELIKYTNDKLDKEQDRLEEAAVDLENLKYNDSVITPGYEIAIKPEQIHILGSKQDIEGFREFVDKTIQKNQIENKKDISKENNYVSAPREINLDFSIFTELKDDIFINCRN